MFLINFLSRNFTIQYYPVFECFYVTEMFLMIGVVCVTIPVSTALWNSQLHRNLRLSLLFTIFHGNFTNVVRLFVIHHQVYGPEENVATVFLILCSAMRESLITYFTSLLIFISIDRFIASRHWEWYERGNSDTILLCIALEVLHLGWSYGSAFALVYDFVSDIFFVFLVAVTLTIGLSMYLYVFLSDFQEIKNLKKGAKINSYSISRTYQLRENINLMHMFTRLAFPFGFVIAPEFVYYPAYSLMPFLTETGLIPTSYYYYRYFAVALYDLQIPMQVFLLLLQFHKSFSSVAIVTIASIPLCQPQIAKHMPRGLRYSLFDEKNKIEQRDINTEADAYFRQLANEWNRLPSITKIVIVSMFLINFLNQEITNPFFPAFECIYAVELVLIVFQTFVGVIVIRAVWRSQLHMNLRLRLDFCIAHTILSSLVRLYVINYQIRGTNRNEIARAVVACSLIRLAFQTYASALMIFIAADRFFASRLWKWYDKGGVPTTLFFSLLGTIHITSTYIASYQLVYGYTSDVANMIRNAIYLNLGNMFYFLVYRSDKRETEILKSGANINSYSITRSYQLKENINLMTMFIRLLIPVTCAILPVFLFYSMYCLIPQSVGYDTIRYFSIALFDVSMAIAVIVAITAIPLCQPQIARKMPKGLRFSFYASVNVINPRISHAETNAYFTQLAQSWNRE